MTVAFMPDGATYNGRPSIPREYFEGMSVGDPLEDDRYLPLIWTQDR